MRNIEKYEIFESIFGTTLSFQEALKDLKEQKVQAYDGASTSSLHHKVDTFVNIFTKKFEAIQTARAVINSGLVPRSHSAGQTWLTLIGGALLNLNFIPVLGSTSAYVFAEIVEQVSDHNYKKNIDDKVKIMMGMSSKIDEHHIFQLAALALGKSLENQLLTLKETEIEKFAHYLTHRIEQTLLKPKNFKALISEVAVKLGQLPLSEKGKSALVVAQVLAKHFYSNAFKSDAEMGNVTLVKKNGDKISAFDLISKPGISAIDEKGEKRYFQITDKTNAEKYGYRTTHIEEVNQLRASRKSFNNHKRFYKISKSPIRTEQTPSVDPLEKSLLIEKLQHKTQTALESFESAKQKYLKLVDDFSEFLETLPDNSSIESENILSNLHSRKLPTFGDDIVNKVVIRDGVLSTYEMDLIKSTKIMNRLCEQIIKFYIRTQVKCVLNSEIDYDEISGSPEIICEVQGKIFKTLLSKNLADQKTSSSRSSTTDSKNLSDRETPPISSSPTSTPISESKARGEESSENLSETPSPLNILSPTSSNPLSSILSPTLSNSLSSILSPTSSDPLSILLPISNQSSTMSSTTNATVYKPGSPVGCNIHILIPKNTNKNSQQGNLNEHQPLLDRVNNTTTTLSQKLV